MLETLKKEKDSLKAEKENVVQVKDEFEAKAETLLKDKGDLKLLHQQLESEVAKLKASLEDAKKQRDAAISERTRLSGEVDCLKASAEELEVARVKWQVHAEAQTDYSNHLLYLLELYMDELPGDVAASIRALPDTYYVEVKAESLKLMSRTGKVMSNN